VLKKIFLSAVFCVCAVLVNQPAQADEYVRGYMRSNGTYVAPYHRSDRDGNFNNNWSTWPNFNPYTGQQGTRITPPQTRIIQSYGPSTSGNSSYRSGAIRFGSR
jgi:hypothetical protein